MKKNLLYIILLSLVYVHCFAATKVQNVRIWPSPEKTRIVFDLSEEQDYKFFTLTNPNRLVIDLKDSTFNADLEKVDLKNTKIVKIRHGKRDKNGLRIVLDLQETFTPKGFMLKPQGEYGFRLVFDLEHQGPIEAFMEPILAQQKPQKTMVARDFIVAIDAGHGGEDPGAIGRRYKTHEKDIVLKVAKRLKNLINKQPGMRGVLIRNNDYYVGLRKRTQIARAHGADLFVSIHADSYNNTSAKGASVFVLSRKGASSEAARWLAESENRSDLIGGVSLDDKSDLLASVLLDLSQTANQAASEEFAVSVLRSLDRVTKLHKKGVQRAGFAVLKSPDVPSILVELGFLSNHKGEAKLRQSRHQQLLANALLSGIKDYLAKKPLPLVQSLPENGFVKHKVKRGETLSEIAEKYQVPVSRIRANNPLKGDTIFSGQTLIIPKGQS